MQQQFEILYIVQIQKRIVPVETIYGNTVICLPLYICVIGGICIFGFVVKPLLPFRPMCNDLPCLETACFEFDPEKLDFPFAP